MLAIDLLSALRCRQACKLLRDHLAALVPEADARRLQWVAEMTVPSTSRPEQRDADAIALSDFGRSFKLAAAARGTGPSIFGTPLPTTGKTAFSVRVDHSKGNEGCVKVGVARADGSLGWGLFLYTGRLLRRWEPAGTVPPPDGWPEAPDGLGPEDNQKQVMKDAAGRPANLNGKAKGAVITVCIDHDAGTLGFRVNGGPLLEALKGFPVGAALRPWVYCAFEHALSFAQAHL